MLPKNIAYQSALRHFFAAADSAHTTGESLTRLKAFGPATTSTREAGRICAPG